MSHTISFFRMNIGVDIRTLMDVQYSGVSEYTLCLLKALLESDNKNKYKFFYNSARDIRDRIPIFAKNAEIISTSYPNKIFNYIMQKGLKYPELDKLLGVDVFFAPHINFFSLSQESKKIITIHDLSFMRYKQFFSVRKNFWHYMLNVKKIMNEFDVIVAISENTKRDIVELFDVPGEKIKVIYSGISSEYKVFACDNPELKVARKKYDLPDNFIFYLGTMEPRKNVLGIIKAFERYLIKSGNKEMNLVLAGSDGWRNGEIFKYLENSKFRSNIKYIGYINSQDKKYIYNLTKLFIFPSFYEGFGFPPLEAMSCGVPIITSNISSLPETVGDSAILVDPLNIQEIYEAIYLILANNVLREKLNERANTNSSKFSWKNVALEYLKLY